MGLAGITVKDTCVHLGQASAIKGYLFHVETH